MAVTGIVRPRLTRVYQMTGRPGVLYPSAVWVAAPGELLGDASGGSFTWIVTPTTTAEGRRRMWSLEGLSLNANQTAAKLWEISIGVGEIDDAGASRGWRFNATSIAGSLAGEALLLNRRGGGSSAERVSLPDLTMNPRQGAGLGWTLSCVTANIDAVGCFLFAWGYTWDITGPNRGLVFARPG